jgi:predicted nucleic acid-binding protein
MTSLSFTDVNVWLALLLEDHVHRASARAWWEAGWPETVAFARLKQAGVLRLLTTSGAMGGKPFTMAGAWRNPEPHAVAARFAQIVGGRVADDVRG